MLSEDILQAAEEEWTLSGRTYTDETADSIKGQKLEFDSIHFVRCRFTDCDLQVHPSAMWCLINAIFPTALLRTAIGRTQGQRAAKEMGAGFPMQALSG